MNTYALSITLHILSAVIWVGGMFFAHQILRPSAAELLDPPQRLPLWVAVFRRFFIWVWIAVGLLVLTGYTMIFDTLGGFGNLGLYAKIMHFTGWVMIAIYAYVYFEAYNKLKLAVEQKDYPTGGAYINLIRRLVGINLLIGIATIIIATSGKYSGYLNALLKLFTNAGGDY